MPTLYTFESDGGGFNTKNFFYDTGREVVVFDAQFTPELARQSLDFIRSQTSNPITYVVITHPNPDKFNGMSVFQKLGARVVASRQTAAGLPVTHAYKKYFFVNLAGMFTDETYPALGQIDIVYDDTYELALQNNETIQLKTLPQPGISTTQTVAYLPALRALIVGDLIHHRAHAWLEGGIVEGRATPTLAGWIADLETLQAGYGDQPGVTVYGGRGEAAPLAEAVAAQIAYLKQADQIVSDYVERLGTQKAELLNGEASRHYSALQKEFEAAFPDYALSYMIQYGVYGLVNSKL